MDRPEPYDYFEFPVRGFWRRFFIARKKPKRYYFYANFEDNNYPW